MSKRGLDKVEFKEFIKVYNLENSCFKDFKDRIVKDQNENIKG